jgi:hypothetical protein
MGSTSAHASPDWRVAHDAMYFVNALNQRKVEPDFPSQSLMIKKISAGHGGCTTACVSEISSAINSWLTGGGMSVGLASSFRIRVATSPAGVASANPISNAVSPQAIGGGLSSSTAYSYQVEAVNSGGTALSAIGAFSTLSSGTSGTPPPIDYEIDLRMGDRHYVQSVLAQIFNVNIPTTDSYVSGSPQYASTSSLLAVKVFQEASFGGGCDVLAAGVVQGYGVEFPRERCFDNMTPYDPPVSAIRRYGSIASVCNRLVDDATTRGAAFTKIFGTSSAGPVTDSQLLIAYRLFYQEKELPEAVRLKLVELGNTQSTNTDRWKAILLGLCVSPGWQSIEAL